MWYVLVNCIRVCVHVDIRRVPYFTNTRWRLFDWHNTNIYSTHDDDDDLASSLSMAAQVALFGQYMC